MHFFRKHEKYTTLLIYACIIVAITVLLVVFGINAPLAFEKIGGFISILTPIILGAIVAYFLSPLYNFLYRKLFAFADKLTHRRALRKSLSLLTTYLIFALIITLLVFLVVPQIANNYEDLIAKLESYLFALIDWVDNFMANSNLFEEGATLADYIDATAISIAVQKFLSEQSGALLVYGERFIALMFNVSMGLFLSGFFIYYKTSIAAQFKRFLTAFLPRKMIVRLINAVRFTHKTFGKYFIGMIFDSLIMGTVVLIVLSICGIPYAPLVSVIVCVTNVIPIFGPFLGAIPGFIIVFLADPVKALWFVVIILIIQQLDGNILAPKILGNSVGVSSVWIIISITIMGGLFGIMGMLIGVPVFVVCYSFIKKIIEKRLRKKSLPTETSYYENDLDSMPHIVMLEETENDE